jgi:hypothetical protein
VDAEKPDDEKVLVVADDGPCAGWVVATCDYPTHAAFIAKLWNDSWEDRLPSDAGKCQTILGD